MKDKHYNPGDTIRTYGPAMAKVAVTAGTVAVLIRVIRILMTAAAAAP